MNNFTFSIITICLNDENCIQKTINSVLGQNYTGYEYIIWDGKSNDNTLNIINKNIPRFEKLGIQYKIVSKKDAGVYDAMNQSVRLASGQWCSFLNAGDYFCNASVLREVSFFCNPSRHVIYGNVIRRYVSIKEKVPAEDIGFIRKRMPFCHQAVFTSRRLFDKYEFDKKYLIAADYNLYLKAFLDGYIFFQIPVYVSVFNTEGISFSNSYERELEFLKIRKNNNLITDFKFIISNLFILKFKVSDLVKRFVGSRFVLKFKILKKRMHKRFKG